MYKNNLEYFALEISLSFLSNFVFCGVFTQSFIHTMSLYVVTCQYGLMDLFCTVGCNPTLLCFVAHIATSLDIRRSFI